MKFNFRKIFVFLSLIFVSFMVIYYGSRLVYYYSLEHKDDDTKYTMIEYLTKSDNLIRNKFLQKDDTYYYPADAKNNYLTFSGLTYRILYLDSDKMYAITDESVTSLKYGLTESYEESNVNAWITNVFLPNLDSDYLESSEVTLLDKETFKNFGENSFLVKDECWILDGDSGLVLSKDGELQKPSNYEFFIGIKPLIILKSNNKYMGGKGTSAEPYVIEDRDVTSVGDLYVGEYLVYNGISYRVIEKNDEGVKVLAQEKLETPHIFSGSSNVYSVANKTDLGYYLNNDYISTINKEDLVLTNWYTGEYHLDYQETLVNPVNAYVGLLRVGDYFITTVPNSFLLSKSGSYIYTINENNILYLSGVNKELDVYPVLTLKLDLNINSGNGYSDTPYVVGD